MPTPVSPSADPTASTRSGDGATPTTMESAARRLTRALTALEQRLLHDAPAASSAAGGSSGSLAADLDQARARNRALENGARQASVAMGQAAAEVRAAMAEQPAAAPARTDEDA